MRYGVPHSPWKTGKAGDSWCFSNKNERYSKLLQLCGCFSNIEKPMDLLVKMKLVN